MIRSLVAQRRQLVLCASLSQSFLCLLSLAWPGNLLGAQSPNDLTNAAPNKGPLQATIVQAVTVEEQAFEWNWGAWDQEKIVSFGDYQYTIYWAADKSLAVARRDLRSNQVQTVHFREFRLSANDRHRNTCLGLSRHDGRLHLSWDHHSNPLNYTRSRAGFLTDPPSQISTDDFEPAQSLTDDKRLEARVTYPRFITDREGELFFFYRLGKSGDGENYLYRYDASESKWNCTGKVASSRGTFEEWNNSKSRNAYYQDLRFDDNNRLHAIWVYREVSSTWASNHDLHYAYSDDLGVTWSNNQGAQVADLSVNDPIEISDPNLVVVEIPVHSWVMNAGPLNFDSQGRPHIVTFKAKEIQTGKHTRHDPTDNIRDQLVFVHYWRDVQGKFRGGEAILPGENGIFRGDLLFDKDDNLFFYYPTDVGIEYYFATSSSEWTDFQGPFLLTNAAFTAPQRNSTKHDRTRWRKEGVLSFTVQPQGGGFAIIDLALEKK